jgi:hypothetical protein
VSGLDDLIRYLTLLPSFSVTERTVSSLLLLPVSEARQFGGGFGHDIHIQPDEGTDNGDYKQPGILPCFQLLS